MKYWLTIIGVGSVLNITDRLTGVRLNLIPDLIHTIVYLMSGMLIYKNCVKK